MIDGRIQVAGLQEFRKGLRGIDASLPKAIQRANKEFAQLLVPKVQARYQSHYPKRTGRGVRSIRALGTQRQAIIAIGKKRVPYMIGQEWGSSRLKRFAPRAPRGRFLYPTVTDEVPGLRSEYEAILGRELREAFPEGGAL